MMTSEEFNNLYWKMFDAGIVENDANHDAMQIEIEELNNSRIYRHRFDVSSLPDARAKIEWLLENTPCYEVTFFNPGHNPVTWRGSIKDNEWNGTTDENSPPRRLRGQKGKRHGQRQTVYQLPENDV